MVEVEINLVNLNVPGGQRFFRSFLYELKDYLALGAVEHGIRSACPGDYKFVRWADPDDSNLDTCFTVIAQFEEREAAFEWMLRWA